VEVKMGYTKKEREEYNERRERTCKALKITENQYNWLRRKGQELQKIYTDACNGVVDYAGEYENKVNPIYKKVDEYAKKIGLKLFYQTDPRGATIYADKKPIPANSYNNSFCIY
jgi:hypothetical protein